MGDYSESWNRTAADDVLDYAMGIGLLATGFITAGLISLGFPALTTTISMAIIGGLWVFTITPHLIAYWLGVDVDALLGIQKNDTIEIPPETTEATDTQQNETNA